MWQWSPCRKYQLVPCDLGCPPPEQALTHFAAGMTSSGQASEWAPWSVLPLVTDQKAKGMVLAPEAEDAPPEGS